jgi:hypothetical protein
MIAVDMMEVAIVEIIGVAIMADGGMPAVRTVDVCMPLLLRARFSHCYSFLFAGVEFPGRQLQ